jgi:hypothetical protein
VKLLALALWFAGLLLADLMQVRSEPNLERRSKLALDYAETVIKASKEAYESGGGRAVSAKLEEASEAVEIARSSLAETGKNPSRSPKYFKYAEIKTRDLVKRLDALAHAMDFADRPLVEPLTTQLRQVQEEMLEGIMGKKRKK